MTDEKKAEIIKSIAFGLSDSDISIAENIPVPEVEQIRYDYADRVAREKEYLNQSGRL